MSCEKKAHKFVKRESFIQYFFLHFAHAQYLSEPFCFTYATNMQKMLFTALKYSSQKINDEEREFIQLN